MTQHSHEDWWASLTHGGLLIASAKIPEFFSEEPAPLSRHRAETLRRDVVRMLDDSKYMSTFLDTVFERVLALEPSTWMKGNQVGTEWGHAAVTGEVVKPRRVWQGPHGETLPLFATDGAWGRGAPRIGVGRGRRAVSRVLEWLRNADQKLAVLTNGRQVRLIHAGADYDAYCEWDIELWFEEGEPGPQVTALRQLLGPQALSAPRPGESSVLLQAILTSRKGQAELSSLLGERVRQAVERLITASRSQIDGVISSSEVAVQPNNVYIAATRIIMRLVVSLFAEARELLPRDNPLYHSSYGIQGLREELDRAAGGRSERLRHRFSAWPRVLSLFRLVFHGSTHDELPIPAYGGGLFQPGELDSSDPISRAVAAFESPDNILSDEVVHRLIELLTRSRVRVRQGRSSTWVEAPVDFSDLSTEYIGILYEGLLDYELRRAPDGDPMVFLNIGDQPALPLSRLDAMTGKERGELLKKLKKDAGSKKSDDEDNAEEAELDEEVAADGEPDAEEDLAEPEETENHEGDHARIAMEMVDIWARNAVRDAGWTRRGADAQAPDVTQAANALVRRVVLPGDWFLVRWGGTRKGAGTFYTRPQLAGPTTRRTLEPLAYTPAKESHDEASGLVDVLEWAPKKPEEILTLRVCDPAMGSGSFLVSALRFLTEALYASLHHHGRLEHVADRTIARLADGIPADHPSAETLPVPPDHEDFEDRLKAKLKRHVVERCIYGVDVDPVAVELARLALWVETMDRSLPFEFLDHKLKCGNSLVGCWLDRFQDYPIAAWERKGGDEGHTNFVHHFREAVATKGKKKGQVEKKGDKWTQTIKDRRDQVRDELAHMIKAEAQPGFAFGGGNESATQLHTKARKVLDRMHAIPVHDSEKRAELYASDIEANEGLRGLRQALDAWCSVWFWPGDKLSDAPTPKTLSALDPAAATSVEAIGQQLRFFHWELEFPDVFNGPESGFDAVIGNPPWDIQKPNSKEFFSNHDPLYRSYGKQEALRRQKELFDSPSIEDAWIAYHAGFKALSNFVRHAGNPCGDPKLSPDGKGVSLGRGKSGTMAHRLWREQRKGRMSFADPAHPFQAQGSADLNTYKMFLEVAHALLRPNGFLGLIVPSGLYTDKGTTELRELFLNRCRWAWLFGFENREKIFDIHRSFKFAPVIVQKGGQTEAIRAAFMRRKLEEWDTPHPRTLAYPRDQVERFSPWSKALLEISSPRDLEILDKMYSNGVLLGDESPNGWGIKYAREFDMTNDSKLFPPRLKWEEKGYIPDEYGHWLKGGWKPYSGERNILRRPKGLVLSRDGTKAINVNDIEDVALPLYQGAMVLQHDNMASAHGLGSSSSWTSLDWKSKLLAPQYLLAQSDYQASTRTARGQKFAFRDICRTTDRRTVIGALLDDHPCGNTLGVLSSCSELDLAAVMNSWVFDWATRQRLGGTHLNWYVAAELPLPSWLPSEAQNLVLSLNFASNIFARAWMARVGKDLPGDRGWRSHWAVTRAERIRLQVILNCLVARSFSMDLRDLKRILRDCDLPSDWNARDLDPKDFWRCDRNAPPELRESVLTVVAYSDLLKGGSRDSFASTEAVEWNLPRELCLHEYGLGHDTRAEESQPVAAVLGARFEPWQTAEDITESWHECQLHGELLDMFAPTPASTPNQRRSPVEDSTSSGQFRMSLP